MSLSRALGDSELAYFLPSRVDGANDMYLHLGFTAPTSLVNPERVALTWAILRGRHPLLASRVLMQPGKYDDVRFGYTLPSSPQHALKDAQDALRIVHSTKDALIDSYLNGPRTLSNDRVSFLVLSSPYFAPQATPSLRSSPDLAPYSLPNFIQECEFDLLICAAHFLGDSMSLHSFTNDLFSLLAASGCDSPDGTPLSDTMLQALLEREWLDRWGNTTHTLDANVILPAPLESRLPPACSTLQRVAFDVEFKCSQERLIGGHSFSRAAHGFHHTIAPTVSFDEDTTKRILKKCKAEGVSISNALFALCNISWARITGGREEQPMMMYAGLNLRPYLLPSPSNPSYWFLAIGYFNVILPTFLPASSLSSTYPSSPSPALVSTFWQRSRRTKQQILAAAKTPLLIPRVRCMARDRSASARRFALLDDASPDARSIPSIPGPSPPPISARPQAPSKALLGLSLLGNLDATYKHASYPLIATHTITAGSRRRAGSMLLFGYTFKGRLWLSLVYDEAGYEKEQVGRWWWGILGGVREFLAQ
ncbi:hypothetical protein K439DRAFT_1628300 [Ramaria rubella]|nr:hypothetical protein K439DRAFT_1628300 [Ramaria rubella]